MKKTILLSLSAIIGLGLAVYGGADASAASNQLYRVYNPNSGEHFYTESASERDGLVKQGWTDEGLGWNTPTSGDIVYRIYNSNAGDHHYTKSVDEYNWLAGQGWTKEGKSFFSSTGQEVAIHRAYNPNAVVGSHNFTQSSEEQNWLVNLQGWTNEGVAFYGVNADATEVNKDALKAAITSATALNEADYTEESYAKLTTALAAAQAVVDNADATQEEVDAQVTALQAAVDALEAVTPAEVDKTALEAKITEAKAIEGTDYTAESYQALQDAITVAETVFNNADATQAQVDAQVTALDAAIAGLVEASTNKAYLQMTYDLVANYIEGDFPTTADWATFNTALNNAKTVLANPDATQDEIDDAVRMLNAASEPSFKDVLRDALQVEAERTLTETDYPAANWATYQAALLAGRAGLRDQHSKTEIDDLATTVSGAFAALDATKYDKSGLQALVAEINALNLVETDYAKNAAEQDPENNKAWADFQEALKTATENADVQNVKIEQTDVEDALTKLVDEYDALLYVGDVNTLLAELKSTYGTDFSHFTDSKDYQDSLKYFEETTIASIGKVGGIETQEGIDQVVTYWNEKLNTLGYLVDGAPRIDFSQFKGKAELQSIL